MSTYKLKFRGIGFLNTAPPDGQIIDGFSCILFLKSNSEAEAREAGLAALHADPAIRCMIDESHEAQVDTWRIECEAVTKLGFWHSLLPSPKQIFSVHWKDEERQHNAAS